MLNKIIFSCLFWVSTLTIINAQQYSINFKLQESPSFLLNPLDSQFEHKAYPIVSKDSTKIMMLLATSGKIKAEYFSSDLKKISSMEMALPEIKELDLLIGGFQGNDSTFFAIFTNKKKGNFSAFNISTKNKEITSTEFSVEIKGEKILYAFPSKGSFLLVSMVSNSSMLRVYQLKPDIKGDNLILSKRTYDFSKDDLDETLPTLYKELLDYTYRGNQSIAKLPLRDEISLVAATSYFKLYVDDEKVILTMDHVHGRTSIFEMNLESSVKNFQLIRSPSYIANNPYKFGSNSFIYGDTLIQMVIAKDGFIFLMYDRFSQVNIYELLINKNQIDNFAKDLTYRGVATSQKENKKSTGRILKDLNKFQSGLVIRNTEGNTIQFEIGASPTTKLITNQLEKKNLAGTHEVFRQSLDNNISSMSIAFDRGTEKPIPAKSITPSYLPVLSFKKSNEINSPLIETLCSVGKYYFYAWYNVASEQLVIQKIHSAY